MAVTSGQGPGAFRLLWNILTDLVALFLTDDAYEGCQVVRRGPVVRLTDSQGDQYDVILFPVTEDDAPAQTSHTEWAGQIFNNEGNWVTAIGELWSEQHHDDARDRAISFVHRAHPIVDKDRTRIAYRQVTTGPWKEDKNP